MKRLALALFVCACSGTPINTPVRSFDAPADVALACAVYDGRAGHLLYEPRPLRTCRPDLANLPQNLIHDDCATLVYQTDLSSIPAAFALVANSARGELALVNTQGNLLPNGLPQQLLVNLHRRIPGYGFLSVGRMPRTVRASVDGCVGVTANVDSCDLAVLDLPVVYNMQFPPAIPDGGVPGGATDAGLATFPCSSRFPLESGYADRVTLRLVPQVGARTLGGRPGELEIAPESVAPIYGDQPGGRPGHCTGGAHFAWVSLPRCQLVVEVAVDGTQDPRGQAITPGQVVRALRITRTTAEVVSDLTTLSCFDECTADPTTTLDAGAATDGGTRLPTTQAFPHTLALEPDPEGLLRVRRLAIGDLTSERLTIVPLDTVTGDVGAPQSITLEPGALGVSKVRISPRSPAGEFLYAIARDGSVRVVDIDRMAECETNPDPRWLANELPIPPAASPTSLNTPDTARRLGCFPLGDPTTPPRSPQAITPGITLNGGVVLPRDIAFVHHDVPFRDFTQPQLPPPTAAPSVMVGDFAWIVGSDGRMYAINLYDACPEPNVPQIDNSPLMYTAACNPANVRPSLIGQDAQGNPTSVYAGAPLPIELDVMSHHARAGQARFATPLVCSDATGAPRLLDEANPQQLFVNGTAVGSGGDGGTSVLPTLVPQILPGGTVQCAPSGQRSVSFPSPFDARSEIWTVAWEGLIPGTGRVVGRFRDAGGGVVTLSDAGGQFCQHGVVRGDKVVLPGCHTDDDCDTAQFCAIDPTAPPEVLTGLCLDRDANMPFQLSVCAPLMRGIKRFRVLEAKEQRPDPATGDVTDWLRLGEIYEPEHVEELRVSGGVPTCASDTDCQMVQVNVGSAQAPALVATRCLADLDGQKRCIRACDVDPRCGEGYQCAPSMLDGSPRCMRAPLTGSVQLGRQATTLLAACVGELATYEVHTGDAFTVSGTASGFLTAIAPDATGECGLPPPTPATREWIRMREGRLPLGRYDWFGRVVLPDCVPADFQQPPDPTTPLTPTPLPPSPLNPLTLDAIVRLPNVCLYKDAGRDDARYENPYVIFALALPPGAARVPPDTFQLTFQVTGGGFPLIAALGASVIAQEPRAAVTAPDGQTIYVVDEGKEIRPFGLRGQLLRFLSTIQSTDRSFIVQ